MSFPHLAVMVLSLNPSGLIWELEGSNLNIRPRHQSDYLMFENNFLKGCNQNFHCSLQNQRKNGATEHVGKSKKHSTAGCFCTGDWAPAIVPLLVCVIQSSGRAHLVVLALVSCLSCISGASPFDQPQKNLMDSGKCPKGKKSN